jgi:membrane-bound lytic murein transglycosylase B
VGGSSVAGSWLLAVGYGQLVTGSWLLAVGYGQLVTGSWLRAVGYGQLVCRFLATLVQKFSIMIKGQIENERTLF